MLRKYVWALVILLVLGVGLWIVYYPNGFATNTTTAPAVTIAAPQITVPTTISYAHAVSGNLESITPVQVTALTSSSITVQLSSTTALRSFAISSSIPVYSTVLAGQTAKGFSAIKVGSSLTVYWHTSDPHAAVALAFPRDEALSLTADDNAHTAAGTITSLTASEVVLSTTDATAPLVTIAITPQTKIATTVTAGQTGRTLKVGDFVVARGMSTSGGAQTAKALVLPPPAGL